MSSQKFFSLYRKLNAEQKKAVDCVEGPVMVIAGPGTGKTQILTLRIANILRKTDTAPENILALTFTESGVFSMRKRLVEIIGGAGYRVRIHTFHGFANETIQSYPDEFPKIIGARHIDDVEKIAILKNNIASLKSPLLKPYGDTFYYVSHVRRKISELKREYFTSSAFKRFIKEEKKAFNRIADLRYEHGAHQGKIKGAYTRALKQIERSEELSSLYAGYEKALAKERLYDFDDMIVETVKALEKNPDLLLKLQEEYQYILADEHQDANSSQNRLLELLASFHKSPNLFIVGDEKQAIFRFQGASLENFLYFKRLYPGARVVTLKDNYRSTQTLLDAAYSLVLSNSLTQDIRVKLLSHRKVKEEPISVYAFSRPQFECAFIAEDIGKKIGEGVSPEEIAVLYRDNKDASLLSRIFEKTRIPFIILSDQNILSDPMIGKLLLLLRTVNDFGNDELLARTLHLDFLGIDNLLIYKLIHYARRYHRTLYDVLGDVRAEEMGIRAQKKLHALFTKLSLWKTESANAPVLDFLERLVEESGFLGELLRREDSAEALEKLGAIFDCLKTLVAGHKEYALSHLVAYFDTLEEHNLPLLARSRRAHTGAVRLMTAHRAKGLEFDYVYIIHAYDGHWGNKRALEYFLMPGASRGGGLPFPATLGANERTDDERRLFYVALTRARAGATITYTKESEEGKEYLPTQFIEEINKKFLREENSEMFEKGLAKQFFFLPPPKSNTSLKNKEFLNTLFLEQGLSVTALNNYLACPWKYFYSNLVRVPKAPEKYASFGTAVHGALKDSFDFFRDGAKPSRKALLLAFERRLKKEPLGKNDYEESLRKGRAALSGYFLNSGIAWRADARTEFKIEVPFSLCEPSLSFPLRGVLDRVEKIENGVGCLVIDYKTGTPKSRNEIAGNTKNSRGDYKRQLVFYKLLLSLYNEDLRKKKKETYEMMEGVIDFIEPDKNGKYRKEIFVVTDEEVMELVELISKTAREIHSLSFWNARCEDHATSLTAGKGCRYCKMRETLG